jgi:hypothetical protein
MKRSSLVVGNDRFIKVDDQEQSVARELRFIQKEAKTKLSELLKGSSKKQRGNGSVELSFRLDQAHALGSMHLNRAAPQRILE